MTSSLDDRRANREAELADAKSKHPVGKRIGQPLTPEQRRLQIREDNTADDR